MSAAVESEADPRRPGRTGYRITGSDAGSVQAAIDTITRAVDPTCGGQSGHAQWMGPSRIADGWGALGVVTVNQPMEDA